MPLDLLKTEWVGLENKANASFFLSWIWIGTWLECFVKNYKVIRAVRKNETVGLGILVVQPPSLLTEYKSLRKQFFLHKTGVSEDDQVWIEYNDFLTVEEQRDEIRKSMFVYLNKHLIRSGSLIIGASNQSLLRGADEAGFRVREEWISTAYKVDLDELRNNHIPLIQSLSKNARAQIRRSLRYFDKLGKIKVNQAQTIEEALRFLNETKLLHIKRWSTASGFNNELFSKFHESIIKKGFSSGVVEFSQIKVGKEILAYIYSFKHNGVNYFYLSGVNYNAMYSKYKPGIIAHYMLIDKELDSDTKIYDFMGGEARYKKTFSNRTDKIAIYRLETISAYTRLEDSARKLNKLFKMIANTKNRTGMVSEHD